MQYIINIISVVQSLRFSSANCDQRENNILLQKLWEIQLDWDESIPQCLETDWQNFKVELSQVDTINVPRFVVTTLNSIIQIHGFADASMKANGCCLYVRYSECNKIKSSPM